MWAATEGHTDVVKALLDAKADPNVKAAVTTLTERKHADHPTGGFTALMYAARNGHEDTVRALIAGGADPKSTNGDGATATIVAIVNDRFDLAKTLIDLGADANDGSLYFAVDMHDATSDMRAKDGSRLRADFPNKLDGARPRQGVARQGRRSTARSRPTPCRSARTTSTRCRVRWPASGAASVRSCSSAARSGRRSGSGASARPAAVASRSATCSSRSGRWSSRAAG